MSYRDEIIKHFTDKLLSKMRSYVDGVYDEVMHQVKFDIDRLHVNLLKAERFANDCKKESERYKRENKTLRKRVKELEAEFINEFNQY